MASKIHIKPKNKGKFTAKANAIGMGVQSFANKVLSSSEGTYSPSTRKQANFAKNALQWNKAAYGGETKHFLVNANHQNSVPLNNPNVMKRKLKRAQDGMEAQSGEQQQMEQFVAMIKQRLQEEPEEQVIAELLKESKNPEMPLGDPNSVAQVLVMATGRTLEQVGPVVQQVMDEISPSQGQMPADAMAQAPPPEQAMAQEVMKRGGTVPPGYHMMPDGTVMKGDHHGAQYGGVTPEDFKEIKKGILKKYKTGGKVKEMNTSSTEAVTGYFNDAYAKEIMSQHAVNAINKAEEEGPAFTQIPTAKVGMEVEKAPTLEELQKLGHDPMSYSELTPEERQVINDKVAELRPPVTKVEGAGIDDESTDDVSTEYKKGATQTWDGTKWVTDKAKEPTGPSKGDKQTWDGEKWVVDDSDDDGKQTSKRKIYPGYNASKTNSFGYNRPVLNAFAHMFKRKPVLDENGNPVIQGTLSPEQMAELNKSGSQYGIGDFKYKRGIFGNEKMKFKIVRNPVTGKQEMVDQNGNAVNSKNTDAQGNQIYNVNIEHSESPEIKRQRDLLDKEDSTTPLQNNSHVNIEHSESPEINTQRNLLDKESSKEIPTANEFVPIVETEGVQLSQDQIARDQLDDKFDAYEDVSDKEIQKLDEIERQAELTNEDPQYLTRKNKKELKKLNKKYPNKGVDPNSEEALQKALIETNTTREDYDNNPALADAVDNYLLGEASPKGGYSPYDYPNWKPKQYTRTPSLGEDVWDDIAIELGYTGSFRELTPEQRNKVYTIGSERGLENFRNWHKKNESYADGGYVGALVWNPKLLRFDNGGSVDSYGNKTYDVNGQSYTLEEYLAEKGITRDQYDNNTGNVKTVVDQELNVTETSMPDKAKFKSLTETEITPGAVGDAALLSLDFFGDKLGVAKNFQSDADKAAERAKKNLTIADDSKREGYYDQWKGWVGAGADTLAGTQGTQVFDGEATNLNAALFGQSNPNIIENGGVINPGSSAFFQPSGSLNKGDEFRLTSSQIKKLESLGYKIKQLY